MSDVPDETKSWNVHVDEDGVLVIPDEAWAALGWKEGDTVEWVEQDDGTFLLTQLIEAPDDSDGSDQASDDAGDD